jgi:hypothetical protein
MRLRLGRHGILLLDPGLLLRPRDEGPLLPRDRHPVQPPRAGSQVEGYRHRRPGRRVRFWNELAAAAEVVNIVAEESKECQTEYYCVARRALSFSHIPWKKPSDTFLRWGCVAPFSLSCEVPYTLSVKLAGSESALSGISPRFKCESGWYYHR